MLTSDCDKDPFRQLPSGAIQHRPSKLCMRAMSPETGQYDVYERTEEGTPIVLSKACEAPSVVFDMTGMGGFKHRLTGKCLQVSSSNKLVLKEGCEEPNTVFDFVQLVAMSRGV